MVWILADHNKIGTINQCLGLAEKISNTIVLKKINLDFPYSYVSPFIRNGILKHAGTTFENPYPDLIIAGGRQAAGVACELAKKIPTIFLMNPYISPKYFKAVITPKHDHLKGDNVISILGVLHKVTKESLEKERGNYIPPLEPPYVTVLLGGDSQHFKYTSQTIDDLKKHLEKIHQKTKANFLITPSRRTRLEILDYIKQSFKSLPHYLWDFSEPNPYLAFLAHASTIVVTSDSISMTCEACFQGKPVFVYDLGIKHKKFNEFYSDIFANNHAMVLQQWDGHEVPSCLSLDEVSRILKNLSLF